MLVGNKVDRVLDPLYIIVLHLTKSVSKMAYESNSLYLFRKVRELYQKKKASTLPGSMDVCF